MKFSTFCSLSMLCTALLSCGSTANTARGNANMQKLEEIVSGKSFAIESDQAFPMTTNALNSVANAGLFPPGSSAGQINLIGNPNYLRIMGDSVSVYLPYFGERQMGGGYDSDGAGIQFKGIPENLEIEKNEEQQRYDIQFKMTDDSETFDVNVNLFPNLKSIINVKSSQRFPIRYSGTVEAFPTDT